MGASGVRQRARRNGAGGPGRYVNCAHDGAEDVPAGAMALCATPRSAVHSGMTEPRVHTGQPIHTTGVPLSEARVGVVMLHGRGDTAPGILGLADELRLSDVAYLAPQAAGNTWYPLSFLAAIERNEPWLSSAVDAVRTTLTGLAKAGIPPERTVLLGFSQGACLAVEFAARHAQRYGGIAVLSGGLIGPTVRPETYHGDFEGTPAFLGCSDLDAHIPAVRVRESGELLRRLGAEVTVRLYPGMAHTVNEEELERVRAMIAAVRDR
jgi:phospholipase/carboxylesterase